MAKKRILANITHSTKMSWKKLAKFIIIQDSRKNLELAEKRYENLKTFISRSEAQGNKNTLIKHCQNVYELKDALDFYSVVLSFILGLSFTLLILARNNIFLLSLLEQSVQFDLSIKHGLGSSGLSSENFITLGNCITIGFLGLYIIVAGFLTTASKEVRESFNYQLYWYKAAFLSLAIIFLTFTVTFTFGFYWRSSYSFAATLFGLYLLIFLVAYIFFSPIMRFALARILTKQFVHSYIVESVFKILYLLETNNIEDVKFRASLCKKN